MTIMQSRFARVLKWKRRGVAAVLAATLLAGQAVPALADEAEAAPNAPARAEASDKVVLLPSDDTFIEGQDEARREKINGAGSSVQAAGNNANERIIYLKFDLEDADAADIGSAVLRLYNNDTRYNRIVTANALDDVSWTESKLAWNNAPAAGGPILTAGGEPATFATEATGNADNRLLGAKYYELDVTEYVKASAGRSKLGFVVKSDGYTSFASKEYESGAYPPQLVISSETTEPPQGPVYKEFEAGGRSSLYPEDWYPGYKDEDGRFLHDFSYAGYRMGQEPIPVDIPGAIIDVTEEPYFADATGGEDATAKIQAAIDAAGESGGGVVYLPAGTYKIKPQGTNNQALKLNRSGVVLRGAGPDQTFLYNDEPVMRGKDIITVASEGGGFQAVPGTETGIRSDLAEPTVYIPVQDASAFQAGDWITVSNRYTADFIAEHDMADWWATYIGNEGITFYRKVVAVDEESGTLTIDIPTRYPLKVRDAASVYKLNAPVTEVGVEHLSIGNAQNLTPGIGESDDTKEGTAGYQVAGTNAINFVRVADAWARNVHSYRPAANDAGYDYHLLSSGIHTSNTRNVTIADCVMQKPLFRGAGGNGYLYELVGNDNLIMNSKAVEGRHNYTFSHMRTNGNVIRNSISVDPTHVIDFHQYLSASNLLDGLQLYGDRIEASVRPYPSSQQNYKHGHTTSQTVIWNTYGHEAMDASGVIVDSRQHGYGYIVGTSGNDVQVRITPDIHSGKITAPVDFAEGIGQGAALSPSSLYEDQLEKRIERSATELLTLKLDGQPIKGFQPGKRIYDIELPYGTAEVPDISAAANAAGATVQVAPAASLPGTAIVTVTSADEAATALYTIRLKAAASPASLADIALRPDRTRDGWKTGAKLNAGTSAYLSVTGMMSDGTEAELGDAEIVYTSDQPDVLSVSATGLVEAAIPGTASVTVSVTLDSTTLQRTLAITVSVPAYTGDEELPVTAVSSSGDDGNVVANALDGDYDTRWSASGEGQWMMADLGSAYQVGSASIAFYNGHTRKSKFELVFSADGEHWTTGYELVPEGNSSGTSSLYELFELDEPIRARYVKYVGYGNSANAWNSISEIRFHPADETSPTATVAPTPTPIPTSGSPAPSAAPTPTPRAASVEAAFDGSPKKVRITSELASVEAAGNMFGRGELGADGQAVFTFRLLQAGEVEGISSATKRAIGDRPILDISLASGGKDISWSNPAVPVTVSLPYQPSDRELANPEWLEKLTIWFLDDEGRAVPVPNARYDADTGAILFKTTHFSRYAVALKERTFGDLDGYDWASGAIGVLAARGVVTGKTIQSFDPAAPVSRAEFAAMIMRALGLSAEAKASFADVSEDAYYFDAVAMAERLGIVRGMPDGLFRPDASIAREDMMVMTYQALLAAGIAADEQASVDLTLFADASLISDYAADGIGALAELGIVQGHRNLLQPQAPATRAEAAALIYRLTN